MGSYELYYVPWGIPNSVRIISDSLGIDTTIIPRLNPPATQGDYCQ